MNNNKKNDTARGAAKNGSVSGGNHAGGDRRPAVDKRAAFRQHRPFLALLVLFAGFSLYAIFSFFTSTNNYIKQFYTSVVRQTAVIWENPEIVAQSKENPFSDLSDSHENSNAVIELYYKGVLTGYGDGTFKPENNVNRAEFAKMLVEAADIDYAAIDSGMLVDCFRDVKDLPDHWFAPAVCAAKYQGWVSGYDSGNFMPAQNINRAEALKIVLSAFGFVVPDNSIVVDMPYEDVSADNWYVGVAYAAQQNGVVSSSGLFNAGKQVSRGEIAQMIYNAMKGKELL